MRLWLVAAVSLLLVASPARAQDFAELDIAELQARMQQGELSAERLVTWYLDRIDEIDRAGPQLNSIIELNPDALTIARALDEERQASGPRGPMHGIPVVLKANINTGDEMHTTAVPVRSYWARPICRNGRISGPPVHRAAGAALAGKPAILTASRATPAAHQVAPPLPWQPISRRFRLAPRPMAPSSVLPASTASSGSSQAWGSSAAAASFRLRTARTRPDQ